MRSWLVHVSGRFAIAKELNKNENCCEQYFTHLYVLRPNRAHARDPQDKTYCVQDIGLPAAVEAGDRIEALVPPADDCTYSIGLEAVNDDFDDLHFGGVVGCDSIESAASLIDASGKQSIQVLALRSFSLIQPYRKAMFNVMRIPLLRTCLPLRTLEASYRSWLIKISKEVMAFSIFGPRA